MIPNLQLRDPMLSGNGILMSSNTLIAVRRNSILHATIMQVALLTEKIIGCPILRNISELQKRIEIRDSGSQIDVLVEADRKQF